MPDSTSYSLLLSIYVAARLWQNIPGHCWLSRSQPNVRRLRECVQEHDAHTQECECGSWKNKSMDLWNWSRFGRISSRNYQGCTHPPSPPSAVRERPSAQKKQRDKKALTASWGSVGQPEELPRQRCDARKIGGGGRFVRPRNARRSLRSQCQAPPPTPSLRDKT